MNRGNAWSNSVHITDRDVIAVAIRNARGIAAITIAGGAINDSRAVRIRKCSATATAVEVNERAVSCVVVVKARIGQRVSRSVTVRECETCCTLIFNLPISQTKPLRGITRVNVVSHPRGAIGRVGRFVPNETVVDQRQRYIDPATRQTDYWQSEGKIPVSAFCNRNR